MDTHQRADLFSGLIQSQMSYVLFEFFGKPRIMESPFDLFSDHTMFRTLAPEKVGDDIHFLVSEIEGAPFSGKSSIIIPCLLYTSDAADD